VKLDGGRLNLRKATGKHPSQTVGDGEGAAVVDEDVAEEGRLSSEFAS
jgi:hypothetical protein